ncbi:DUF2244 domain-containing protein [Pararoseomonas indoligenes]|uniref:DUF2244 domain-containing protein n=1 Tax=Roseomonas indoligenes TaxID=2820811 RepID=A0A940N4B8_9PROT|nr:DUF2244 domain-containing protein [Pararoseomonas indoligenes]MBP0496442.1 DUF2244 domain-containing protein [Pararoseomonas indoligenes]
MSYLCGMSHAQDATAPEIPLFEAVTTPHQSGTPLGLRVLVGLVALGSAGLTVLFWSLGAWPVAGFMGGEVVLVVALLRAHRRWSDRLAERITLSGGRLRVERTDRRGRRRALALDAYWARVVLTPRPGRVSELRLAVRGRSVEIGGFLGEDDKLDLAQALGRALRAYREPVFDNPQLRP